MATIRKLESPFVQFKILPRYAAILYAASGWSIRCPSGATIDSRALNESLEGTSSSCVAVVARLTMTFASLRMSGGSWRIPRIATRRVLAGWPFLCLLFLCGVTGHPEPELLPHRRPGALVVRWAAEGSGRSHLRSVATALASRRFVVTSGQPGACGPGLAGPPGKPAVLAERGSPPAEVRR